MLQGLQRFLHKDVSIVQCDGNDLVALEKSRSMLSHPNTKNDEPNSLLGSPYDFEKQAYVCEGFGKVYMLNHLDAPISGLIFVGLNSKVSEAVKIATEGRKISK
ncbi:MAG: hypothetical protein LBQ23_01440 [Puniceicoccales bacterium]|nr:hypothetical protein [Puniceicoccales bacterium]